MNYKAEAFTFEPDKYLPCLGITPAVQERIKTYYQEFQESPNDYINGSGVNFGRFNWNAISNVVASTAEITGIESTFERAGLIENAICHYSDGQLTYENAAGYDFQDKDGTKYELKGGNGILNHVPYKNKREECWSVEGIEGVRSFPVNTKHAIVRNWQGKTGDGYDEDVHYEFVREHLQFDVLLMFDYSTFTYTGIGREDLLSLPPSCWKVNGSQLQVRVPQQRLTYLQRACVPSGYTSWLDRKNALMLSLFSDCETLLP